MMDRVTIWAEPLNSGDFEPFYVCQSGVRTARCYPEYFEVVVRRALETIYNQIGSKPCLLQGATETWTPLYNGGYDYVLQK